MVKSITIDGKERPFTLSMSAIESFLFRNKIKLTDLQEYFNNISTDDLPKLILEGFRVGSAINGQPFDLTLEDLLQASLKGEVSLLKLAEDLDSAIESDGETGN